MTFGEDERVMLHFRVARCAKELGDEPAALQATAIALAIDPLFRPALLLRSELADSGDPFARAADQLALANTAPVEERAAKFAALGDTYAQLGDPLTAREMYREALLYQPADRMLLTKSLGLVADEGDWSYSLDLVQRLAEGEPDASVRARYRHLAATIARDNLDDADKANELFARAIADDPQLFVAADELEATLTAGGDRAALAAFYYRRLEHVRNVEHRAGERLRLWDRLGELLLALGRLDDAVVAREVGLSLEPPGPNNRTRREALAELYAKAGSKHDAAAIAHHHSLLAIDRRRRASYVALRALYKRRGLIEQARACEDALAYVPAEAAARDSADLDGAVLEELFAGDLLPAPASATAAGGEATRRPLGAEDWAALSREGIDPQLTLLFSLLAPPWAAERVRAKPPRAARRPRGARPRAAGERRARARPGARGVRARAAAGIRRSRPARGERGDAARPRQRARAGARDRQGRARRQRQRSRARVRARQAARRPPQRPHRAPPVSAPDRSRAARRARARAEAEGHEDARVARAGARRRRRRSGDRDRRATARGRRRSAARRARGGAPRPSAPAIASAS